MIELKAKEDLESPPTTFEFAKAKTDTEEFLLQRYKDADLASATQTISLEQQGKGLKGTEYLWRIKRDGVFIVDI